ncbi:MAG: Ig-like domain-containing protein [Gemmataceae bacterium]
MFAWLPNAWRRLIRLHGNALAERTSSPTKRRFRPCLEGLEDRLTPAPVAVADVYSFVHDRSANVSAANGVLGNDSDPGNAPLTAVLVTPPSNSYVMLNSDGSFTVSPGYHFVGDDSFTYQAFNGTDYSDPATVTLHVTNQTPTVSGKSYTGLHDQTINVGAPGVLDGAADGDGDTISPQIVAYPSHGYAFVDADGSLTYEPSPGYVGQDSFSFAASDGVSQSAPATVNITITDAAPTAQGTNLIVREGHTATIDLNTLTSDPDWDGLTFTITQWPTYGYLSYNSQTDEYDYIAPSDFDGTDSFTFKANDSALDSNVATVSIAVHGTNTAPVASDGGFSGTHDNPIAIDLVALGTDADNDFLTSTVVTQPSHGVVVDDGGGPQYIPDEGFTGTDSFTFKLNDDTDDSNVATVTLTITNVAPTTTDFGPVNVAANGSVVPVPRQFAGNASDPDGDVLRVAVIDQPAHGLLMANDDGTFNYTPDTDYVGSDAFTYVLSDGVANSNVGTVLLNVVSDTVAVNDLYFNAVAAQAYELSPTELVTHVSAATQDAPMLTQVAGVSIPTAGETSVGLSSGSVVTLRDDGSVQYLPAPGVLGEEDFTFAVSLGGGVRNATVHMLVRQVAPETPRLGAPVSGATLSQVLVTSFNAWMDIRGATADDDAISLDRINDPMNGLIASRALSVDQAAAVAVLKSLVLQDPAHLLQAGDYGDLFGAGALINQRLTRSGLAQFAAALTSPTSLSHARARRLELTFQWMVRRLSLNVAADAIFPADNNTAWRTVQQGQIGDCSFLSALIGLARTNFAAIRGRISRVAPAIAGGPRRYQATFFNAGAAVNVTIDEPTYTERALYANTTNGALWVSIMEKAYVTQWPPDTAARYAGSLYDVAANGERGDRAIARVTGRATALIDPLGLRRPAFWASMLEQANPSGMGNPGKVVVVSSKPTADMPVDFRGIFPPTHAFSVVAFDGITGRVTLRNPWSIGGAFGEQFQLPFDEFRELFLTVSVQL